MKTRDMYCTLDENMNCGLIFDIKEFSVHDGPGVRQTVFLKGCPLRCNWCHNPEGQEYRSQLLVKSSLCISCGVCKKCSNIPCIACGQCVKECPARARFISGEWVTPEELVSRLNRNKLIYRSMDGGVTFSGGEPLMQAHFLFETVQLLGKDTHLVLDTCGYADDAVFERAIDEFDLIYLDIKLMNPEQHYKFTGKRNELILSNAQKMIASGRPFVVRIPLIPDVTDTEENYVAVAEFFLYAKNLQYIELLPYNRMAGVKYEWLNRVYKPIFDENKQVVFRNYVFEQYGINCKIR